MNIKTFGVGCGVVVFALIVFAIYRIASPWETMRFGGYEVQRNRLTERVRLRVGDDWVYSLNDGPHSDPIAESELSRVKLSDLAFGPHGYLCGKATVTGDKPLTGRLAVHIVVRNRVDGKRRLLESERDLRCNVDWSPGGPHPFVLNSAITPPSAAEKFEVSVLPMAAVN